MGNSPVGRALTNYGCDRYFSDKIVFHNRYKELIQLLETQKEVFIPLIRSRVEVITQRRQCRKEEKEEEEEESVVAYVDSLFKLQLPDEKTKLDENDIVSLCSEFLNTGTDTTIIAMEWIMANLVKYPHIQAKLHEEINELVGPPPKLGENNQGANMRMIMEKDLQRMSYLKFVVLEALRRHPPTHFALPHSVTEDVELEGYLVPKDTIVNIMVANIGWDPKVWDEPMKFKPERFFKNTTISGEAAVVMSPRLCLT
ncbi:hypothetical protein Vadar_004304 [Vaccinium darrowii]|uniref:Uncharacterized protein n=1 Tax=Vaccinium darrowii TaxID=229202 RepID=A0ACB7YJ73_9ERIC|nr:hypothetical protein Vadar_004304 [Vaccinium darrowii]